MHVFLQIRWIGLYGANRAYLHLETPILQEVLPSKTIHSLDAASSNIDGFLWRDTCVSSTRLNMPIGNKWAFVHLENYDLQENSFQKLTQFWQWNNVLNSPVSNTDGFFLRNTCVFTTYLIGLLEKNRAYPHLEKCDFQEVFLSKTNSILRVK
jgi:hypothetical protein